MAGGAFDFLVYSTVYPTSMRVIVDHVWIPLFPQMINLQNLPEFNSRFAAGANLREDLLTQILTE
jgi:hypothetical protein